MLHEKLAVIVANPEHVKARQGEKTDPEDSRRLAERLRVGDARGSFVPAERIQQLRDLRGRRKRLLGDANPERNRVQKVLERANVKISNVVSDTVGISDSASYRRFLVNRSCRRKRLPIWPGDVYAPNWRRSPRLCRDIEWMTMCAG